MKEASYLSPSLIAIDGKSASFMSLKGKDESPFAFDHLPSVTLPKFLPSLRTDPVNVPVFLPYSSCSARVNLEDPGSNSPVRVIGIPTLSYI